MAGRPIGSRNKTKNENSLEKFFDGENTMSRTIDKVLKEIEELRKQFGTRMDQMENEMKENRKTYLMEIMTLRKDMEDERKTREEEFRREKEEWKEERRHLEGRIKTLEVSHERREREERKKNIVITGVQFNESNLRDESTKFFKDKLNIDVGVQSAHSIKITNDRKLTIISLENREQKIEIMKKKKELDRGIYVEDDLTRKERNIQKLIRDMARDLRSQGKDARVGYMKMYVDGRCHRYNEKEEKMEEGNRRGGTY